MHATIENPGLASAISKSKEKTQAALSKKTGVNPKTLSAMVTGRLPVPPQTAVLFEQLVGVPRWKFRPDDWWKFWPDLVGTKGAPAIPESQSTSTV